MNAEQDLTTRQALRASAWAGGIAAVVLFALAFGDWDSVRFHNPGDYDTFAGISGWHVLGLRMCTPVAMVPLAIMILRNLPADPPPSGWRPTLGVAGIGLLSAGITVDLAFEHLATRPTTAELVAGATTGLVAVIAAVALGQIAEDALRRTQRRLDSGRL